nr:uncharacterized protein LOC108730792 [Ipomoea batatas]
MSLKYGKFCIVERVLQSHCVIWGSVRYPTLQEARSAPAIVFLSTLRCPRPRFLAPAIAFLSSTSIAAPFLSAALPPSPRRSPSSPLLHVLTSRFLAPAIDVHRLAAALHLHVPRPGNRGSSPPLRLPRPGNRGSSPPLRLPRPGNRGSSPPRSHLAVPLRRPRPRFLAPAIDVHRLAAALHLHVPRPGNRGSLRSRFASPTSRSISDSVRRERLHLFVSFLS